MPDLRERAARCLGWSREIVQPKVGPWEIYRMPDGGYLSCDDWFPDERIEQARELVAECNRRGKQHEFSIVLSLALIPMGWRDWRDSWALLTATPRKITEAAVAVLTNGESK